MSALGTRDHLDQTFSPKATHAQASTAMLSLWDAFLGLFGSDGTPKTALSTMRALGANVLKKSANYTLVEADRNAVVLCEGTTWTLSLTALATLGAGYCAIVWNRASGDITIDPNSTEKIKYPGAADATNGDATLVLKPNECALIAANDEGGGTRYWTVPLTNKAYAGQILTSPVIGGTGTATFSALTVQTSSAGTDAQAVIRNTDGTNSASHATQYIRVSGASGADPRTWHSVDGENTWSSGQDATDGKYKIALGTALGSGDAIIIDAVGSVNRSLIFTPSNGGNYQISTSAADLVLAPASGTVTVSRASGAALLNIESSGTNSASANFKNTGGAGNLFSLSADNAGNITYNSQVSGGVHRFYSNNGGSTLLAVEQNAGTDDTHVRIISAASGANARILTNQNNLVLGSGADLATSAVAGHIMIPTCNGAATGAVTDAANGRVPFIYDRSNNKLMVLSGGTWRSTAALT